MKTDEELIRQFVERKAQWNRIYPSHYLRKYFRPYDEELWALVRLAEGHVHENRFVGEGI